MKASYLAFIGSFSAIFIFFCFFCFVMPFAIFFGITSALMSIDSLEGQPNYKYYAGDKDSDNKILKIDVNGVILGRSPKNLGFFDTFAQSGVTYGYDIKDQLTLAAEDEDIKGVILEIDSPGGTIYGSQAILDGIKYYKETTGNPVISFVKGMAASGAYWSILPSDQIIADFGTSVGSIGVIIGPFQYYNKVLEEDGGLLSGGVVTQNGIETFYITAGDGKDFGNPYRKLTEKELSVLQTSVNNEYENFTNLVSDYRGISKSDLKNKLGALIYDNKLAKEYKLIDETGNEDFAYAQIADLSGIKNDFQLIYQDNTVTTFASIRGTKSQMNETIKSICINSKVMLAYYGDLKNLCD